MACRRIWARANGVYVDTKESILNPEFPCRIDDCPFDRVLRGNGEIEQFRERQVTPPFYFIIKQSVQLTPFLISFYPDWTKTLYCFETKVTWFSWR
jgi:hypothetical protein